MYNVDATLPVSQLDPGTSVLCHGPPMAGKRSLGVRTLAAGLSAGEGAVAVTAQRSSSELREEFEAAAPDVDSSRLVVVDCTASTSGTGDGATVSVSSPGDLTGTGMAVTDALSTLHEEGVERTRILLDSVSTFLMYGEFERVYRFCHTLVQHVDSTGALAILTADTETMAATEAESLRGLFDAEIELDVTDEGEVYRFQSRREQTAWEPVPEPTRWRTTATNERRDGGLDVGRVTGLSALVDRVASTGYTLTLFAPQSSDGTEAIRSFFERQNVAVETAETPTDGPVDFAVLHRGGDYQAAAPLSELRDAVDLDGIEQTRRDDSAGRRLLANVESDVFSARSASVSEMIRISRDIEEAALAAGSGELHAGFQRLSRVADDRRTRRMYEAVADRGVDVHLYGVDDAGGPLDDRFAVHADDGDEIADSWFALFDGGDGRRRGLVCEERGDREYSGFWTFDDGVVERTVDYLRRAY